MNGDCEGDRERGECGELGARRPRESDPIEGSAKQLHLNSMQTLTQHLPRFARPIDIVSGRHTSSALPVDGITPPSSLTRDSCLFSLCCWWGRSVGTCWLCSWLEFAESTPIASTSWTDAVWKAPRDPDCSNCLVVFFSLPNAKRLQSLLPLLTIMELWSQEVTASLILQLIPVLMQACMCRLVKHYFPVIFTDIYENRAVLWFSPRFLQQGKVYIDGVADSNTPRRMKSWSQTSHFQHNHPHRTADLGRFQIISKWKGRRKAARDQGGIQGKGLNYSLALEAELWD